MKVYILVSGYYPYQTGPADLSIEFVYTDEEKAKIKFDSLVAKNLSPYFWEIQQYEVEE